MKGCSDGRSGGVPTRFVLARLSAKRAYRVNGERMQGKRHKPEMRHGTEEGDCAVLPPLRNSLSAYSLANTHDPTIFRSANRILKTLLRRGVTKSTLPCRKACGVNDQIK